MRMRFVMALIVGASVLAGGCGPPAEKFVRVAGRVTVSGKPLTSGHVGFLPDETRGATHPEYSIGALLPDGTFELVTNDKGGVRPGWYKVVIWAPAEPMPEAPSYDATGRPKPIRWLTATKYTRRETTDLNVEVVDDSAPGAYDLNLSSP